MYLQSTVCSPAHAEPEVCMPKAKGNVHQGCGNQPTCRGHNHAFISLSGRLQHCEIPGCHVSATYNRYSANTVRTGGFQMWQTAIYILQVPRADIQLGYVWHGLPRVIWQHYTACCKHQLMGSTNGVHLLLRHCMCQIGMCAAKQ